ncbi:hypothetical protein DPMN_124956 [Dreissena polymorpha]|uniref:Uncharacterized protein n=1 Tax=Dreissena polymorpha TaxID=45954 RepID=A0A9D4H0G9_DREPO|nr:hypothetical protein DPMN_124956 [Dreissena polymorpha]
MSVECKFKCGQRHSFSPSKTGCIQNDSYNKVEEEFDYRCGTTLFLVKQEKLFCLAI